MEVDKNYRIVLTKEIRNILPIKPGQKIYALVSGEKIILIPLPESLDKELNALSADIKWNRKIREGLEQYLISQTREKKND